jgi:hypothetical protein
VPGADQELNTVVCLHLGAGEDSRFDLRGAPLEEQLYITRMATTSKYLNIARVAANPAYIDLSIDPSTRIMSSLLAPDPHVGTT